MTNNEKLTFIKEAINKTYCKNKLANKAKIQRFDFYTENINRLENISIEDLKKHRFDIEVINLAFELEKLDFVTKRVFKKIKGIEVHNYAPELNKIILTNGYNIAAPQITDIEKALLFITKSFSLTQLKAL